MIEKHDCNKQVLSRNANEEEHLNHLTDKLTKINISSNA